MRWNWCPQCTGFRNTVTLFAALNAIEGSFMAQRRRHRPSRIAQFFNKSITDAQDLDIHLIQDNYTTHRASKRSKAWLGHHERGGCHFTPTWSAWINLLKHFFTNLTESMTRNQRLRFGQQTLSDINTYLTERNTNPRPL